MILAAGAGTRLGGTAKALLVGSDGRTFLRRIVDTLAEVGVELVVVVVGPPFAPEVGSHVDEIAGAVAKTAPSRRIASIVNPDPSRGMASSVATGFWGLQSLGEAYDAAWLWPVDHPRVEAATLRGLISALMNHDAARPVYQGRGGHPPLIARSLFGRLAACADIDGGARSVLASADTLDVPVDDPGVVRDVDTPADLEGV